METAECLRDLRATKYQNTGDVSGLKVRPVNTAGQSSKIGARMTGSGLLRLLGGAILGGLAACGGSVRPGDSAARQAIEAAVTRYVAASNQGDAEALTALYTEDAVLLPPDQEKRSAAP